MVLNKTTDEHGDSYYVTDKAPEIEKLTINIRTLPGVEVPKVLSVGNWIDLCSAEKVYIEQACHSLISLGIAMEIPKGYEAHILPRSSTFKKWGIIMANSMGIVDNTYCGDNDIWMFSAIATRNIVIEKGDRIAQFRIVEIQPSIRFNQVGSLGNKDRGGFGSTG